MGDVAGVIDFDAAICVRGCNGDFFIELLRFIRKRCVSIQAGRVTSLGKEWGAIVFFVLAVAKDRR